MKQKLPPDHPHYCKGLLGLLFGHDWLHFWHDTRHMLPLNAPQPKYPWTAKMVCSRCGKELTGVLTSPKNERYIETDDDDEDW